MSKVTSDPFSSPSISRGGYDQVIIPYLKSIFGTAVSNKNPVVGTSGGIEPFVLNRHTVLLNSLDIRGDIEILLKEGLDPSVPVLIYVLTNARIERGATVYSKLDLTFRASRIFGNLTLKGTRGQDGIHGFSYKGNPANSGVTGTFVSVGLPGENAIDEIPPLTLGRSAGPGGIGPTGGQGTDGTDGLDGGDGTDGTDGNGFILWVERFEDGDLTVIADGGSSGKGGWGQEGGRGGDGAPGGRGGRGGDAALTHPPARGGDGGTGGNGGIGGDGGKAGQCGKPGENGKVTVWVPGHENAKPPSRVNIPRAGQSNVDRPGHGLAGSGGNPGAAGAGGKGGNGFFPTHVSDGSPGWSGELGEPGKSGREYKAPILEVEAKFNPPDLDFNKNPSEEIRILDQFLPEQASILPEPRSTVFDDWDSQAFFEGMSPGPIGPRYTFNSGNSNVKWDSGVNLEISDWGPRYRGLIVPRTPGHWLELEISCPTLLVLLSLTAPEGVVIEGGRHDAATGYTTWDSTPLLSVRSVGRERPIMFTYKGKLGQKNRLRFSTAPGAGFLLIHSIVVTDCLQCRNLPDC